MASAFRPLAGLIETDLPWREPHPKVLRQPAAHQPADSRVVFHETVHYWQQLTQGFMAKLAEEDWLRLTAFESGKADTGPGPWRRELVRLDPAAGFSARDLQESLARFWDVHVIGPHTLLEIEFQDPRRSFDEAFQANYFTFKKKGLIVHPLHGGYSSLAFDMAMNAAAGHYARPYQYVQQRMNPALTGALFPLVGHFAMQTERPAEVFVRAIAAAAQSIGALPPERAIHDLWSACYSRARNATLAVAQQLGMDKLMMSPAVIQGGPLKRHPVYAWTLAELGLVARLAEDIPLAQVVCGAFTRGPPGTRGVLTTDFCLACPGDTTSRSLLIEYLAPPCVSFADGARWLLPELHRRELVPELDETEAMISRERAEVAEAAMKIHQRWQALRRVVRGY